MPPSSTISSKGQVTVPIEARPATNPFTAYLGAFPAFSTREEINAYYRDLRDDDPWVEKEAEEGTQ